MNNNPPNKHLYIRPNYKINLFITTQHSLKWSLVKYSPLLDPIKNKKLLKLSKMIIGTKKSSKMVSIVSISINSKNKKWTNKSNNLSNINKSSKNNNKTISNKISMIKNIPHYYKNSNSKNKNKMIKSSHYKINSINSSISIIKWSLYKPHGKPNANFMSNSFYLF